MEGGPAVFVDSGADVAPLLEAVERWQATPVAILRTHARVAVRVASDPALRRPVDVPRVVGSHAKATRDTGWEPRIAWTDTLAAVLENWRARVAAEG